LQPFIEKNIRAGINVKTVIGDTARSEKDNYIKKNQMELVSRLHAQITRGGRKKEYEFEFNKDTGIYVCKAGHMATRKARLGKKDRGKNQADTYYFNVEQCKRCPLKRAATSRGPRTSSTRSALNRGSVLNKKRYFRKVRPSRKSQGALKN
jgi:hypothetical protein